MADTFENTLNNVLIQKLTKIDEKDELYLRYVEEQGFQWRNKLALLRAYQIGDFYLKRNIPITTMDKNRGGIVLWLNLPSKIDPSKKYDSLMIRDIAITHLRPSPHIDFLFLTIKMHIPADKIKNISNITDSASYYPLGQLLTVSCHQMQASVATLAIIKLFADGYVTLQQANNLYEPYIKILSDELNEVEEDMSKSTPLYDIFERFIFGVEQQSQNMPYISNR